MYYSIIKVICCEILIGCRDTLIPEKDLKFKASIENDCKYLNHDLRLGKNSVFVIQVWWQIYKLYGNFSSLVFWRLNGIKDCIHVAHLGRSLHSQLRERERDFMPYFVRDTHCVFRNMVIYAKGLGHGHGLCFRHRIMINSSINVLIVLVDCTKSPIGILHVSRKIDTVVLKKCNICNLRIISIHKAIM